jgi:hypothetical protein
MVKRKVILGFTTEHFMIQPSNKEEDYYYIGKKGDIEAGISISISTIEQLEELEVLLSKMIEEAYKVGV